MSFHGCCLHKMLLRMLSPGLLLLFSAQLLQAQSMQSADLVFRHGRVWTGDAAKPWAEAVAIRGERIVSVDSDREINLLIGTKTQVIDLRGRLLMAGFNDAHIHFLGGSLGLLEIDLTGARTMKVMQERIREFARAHPEAKWITGRGWEYSWFADALPHRRELDAVVGDRPVFLRAYDGHTGWANSKALALAGVTKETKFAGFGEIVVDAKTGEPTGALKEGAQSLVARLIAEPSREEKLRALKAGLRLAASLGITSMQNASGDPDALALYAALLDEGALTVRTGIAFSVGARTTTERLQQFAELREKYRGHPMLRAGAVKIMLDGVIESHTAALLDPYSDAADTRGNPSFSADEYNALVERCDRAGFQIYTHAIGDRAVRMVLDAYEAAQQANPQSAGRHRIEHIETISPQDIPRFAKLGVMASMEPIHADPGTIEVWSRAVGQQRLPLAFAWNSLDKAGARLVFSSDWPAAISVNPLRGLHNAVNRRTTEGHPKNGWISEQRVSLEKALQAYTAAGAYASFEENIKGHIAPGRLADMIVLSQDLFKIAPQDIHKTRVVVTVFNGRVIYQSDSRK